MTSRRLKNKKNRLERETETGAHPVRTTLPFFFFFD